MPNDPELIRSPHSGAPMQRHFMTVSTAECACVRGEYWVALSCSHCDVVNQSLQIRRIVHWSAVALSSLMLKITTDVPVSDVRHHYRSDTTIHTQISTSFHTLSYRCATLSNTQPGKAVAGSLVVAVFPWGRLWRGALVRTGVGGI